MFAIATPQTVKLMETPWVDPALPPVPPDADHPTECAGTVSFEHSTDDVSQCRMTVRVGEKVWTHDFAVNGACSGSAYEDEAIREAKEAAAKKAEEPAADPDGKAYLGADGYVKGDTHDEKVQA